MNILNQSLKELAGHIILWAPKFTIGVFVLLGFWWGSLLAWNFFAGLGRRADFNTGYVLKVIGRTLSFGMVLLGGFVNALSGVDGHA